MWETKVWETKAWERKSFCCSEREEMKGEWKEKDRVSKKGRKKEGTHMWWFSWFQINKNKVAKKRVVYLSYCLFFGSKLPFLFCATAFFALAQGRWFAVRKWNCHTYVSSLSPLSSLLSLSLYLLFISHYISSLSLYLLFISPFMSLLALLFISSCISVSLC